MISNKVKKNIDIWVKKYPKGQQKSAVMAALKFSQEENNGSLTPQIITEIADYLAMPKIAVAEVATFYENYNNKPVGKYTLRVCHNISCMLRGSDDIINYLEDKLALKSGQTTTDNNFTLKKVECLGACVGAPMMQVGDDYYENLTTDKVDNILDKLLKLD